MKNHPEMMMTETRKPYKKNSNYTTRKAMKTISLLFTVALVLTTWNSSIAQDMLTQDLPEGPFSTLPANDTSGVNFFASDVPIEMSLTFNFKEYLKTRYNPEYIDAVLTLVNSDSSILTQRIRIKARGEMRRSYCSFPPVMLKFKQKGDEPAPIRKSGTLKLVTPCNQNAMYEGYVLKEYLAYKMFNLVTPYSFKTRLVKIKYIDSGRPRYSLAMYGFLIENEKDMAARHNCVLIENRAVNQTMMNTPDMARVAVYNYMIGNTDWWLPSQHNVKVMTSLRVLSEKAIPVAYDFDYAGLVNTEYAVPPKNIPVQVVTERYYMGMCYSEAELQPVIEEFEQLKEEFLQTISDFDLLPRAHQKKMLAYVESFYKKYRFQSSLIANLNKTCRPLPAAY